MVIPFNTWTLLIIKETGSHTDGSVGTKLQGRVRQTESQQLSISISSEWQCWTWPQAQTLAQRCDPQLDDMASCCQLGVILFLSSSPLSLTFPVSFTFVLYSMFYLFCDVSGWLMDDCRSEFITSTGLLDMDTTDPILTSSSSWLGHQTHHCILLLLAVVSSPLVAELSLPPLHHLSRWWHPSHVAPDRLLCVMSRCLILHLYPVSHC